MKKIIIALLVVLSVFALVSCSSSEPVVTAQTLTMSTIGNSSTEAEKTATWATQLTYSKTGYGAWYKTTDGKYVAVSNTALTNAEGKIIGTLNAEFEDIKDKSSQAAVDAGTVIAKSLTIKVGGDGTNAGSWTGEVAIATKAVSDTQLSGVVAKYNLTFTNTIEAKKVKGDSIKK